MRLKTKLSLYMMAWVLNMPSASLAALEAKPYCKVYSATISPGSRALSVAINDTTVPADIAEADKPTHNISVDGGKVSVWGCSPGGTVTLTLTDSQRDTEELDFVP